MGYTVRPLPRFRPALDAARDFGARDDGATDCTPALQAALDAARPGDAVYVPGSYGAYYCRRPLRVPPGVSLRGDGPDASRLIFGGSYCSGLVLSADRWAVDPAHRRPAAGVYDGTVGGDRWALATNKDSWVTFEGAPPAAFDWQDADGFGIEIVFAMGDGGPVPKDATVCGIGDYRDPGDVQPFSLFGWDEPDRLQLMFRTDDQAPGERPRVVSLRLPPGGGVRRLRWYVSAKDADAWAYLGGKRLPVERNQNAAPGRWKPGAKVGRNDKGWPFVVGAGPFAPNGASDLVVYGLRILRAARPGGDTVDARDADLFTADADTVCYLPLTDRPGDTNLVTAANGPATFGGESYGLVVRNAAQPGGGTAVAGLSVEGGPYGQGLSVGQGCGYRVRDVRVAGFWSSVGSETNWATYPVLLDGLDLSGPRFAGLKLYKTLATATRLTMDLAARYTARLDCCSLDLDGLDVLRKSDGIAPWGVVKATGNGYGGNFRVRKVMHDMEAESDAMPAGCAAFHFDAYSDVPQTSVLMDDVDVGFVGDDNVLLRLSDQVVTPHPEMFPANARVRRLSGWQKCGAVVETDGPLWDADLDAASVPKAAALRRHTGRLGAPGRVRVNGADTDGAPSRGPASPPPTPAETP